MLLFAANFLMHKASTRFARCNCALIFTKDILYLQLFASYFIEVLIWLEKATDDYWREHVDSAVAK